MTDSPQSILTWYQQRLADFGDSAEGIGWPTQDTAEIKYQVMLEMMPPDQRATLLDFGCGPARMLDWMHRQSRWNNVQYTGLDFNSDAISIARRKYPQTTFLQMDVLSEPLEQTFDYVVLNGVLTMKAEVSFDAMWQYAQRLLSTLFKCTNRALAFNVMSKAVDWEKDILFHLPTDLLIDYLTRNLSRRFVIRQDYAPFEYTVYVYR